LNFIGQILLSPVDGADPYGIRPIFVITPGEKVNYTIPTLQIVTGLDPVPSSIILFLSIKKNYEMTIFSYLPCNK